METRTRILHSLDEMAQEAQAFVDALLPVETSATLVTLSGELGAGKTAFTQFVAQALGVTETVNSPTFVIEKVYGLPDDGKFARFVHIDAYRLKDMAELTALGFGEVSSHPRTLIFLEWPEHVVGIGDNAFVRIMLEALPDGSRQITYA